MKLNDDEIQILLILLGEMPMELNEDLKALYTRLCTEVGFTEFSS